MPSADPGICFTNISRALQNNLAKIYNARNNIYAENFKLKLCTCAQSMALGTRAKFQLEIIIRSTILVIYKFWETILESSRNVSETPPRSLHGISRWFHYVICCPSLPIHPGLYPELILGLSRVTDYPWAVRFSVVTGYKFTNRLTGSCTDDLLETWSCQNHEKVEETLVNPSYIWAKMRLLSVFGPLTGTREPVNWHFLPLEVAGGQVPPGGGIGIWF